jgi:hypothetical protein
LSVGIGLIAAGASFGAQTAPRQLPASPQQNQAAPAPDQRTDRTADRPGGRFANRIERRLDFLHYELRITPAQQRLWDSFAGVVRSEAGQVRDRLARGSGGPGPDGSRADNDRREPPSVVERLEQRQQRLANQTTRVDRLLGALRPLYTALDANQKRTADRLMFQQDFNRFRHGPGRFAMNGRFNRGFERDYR